MKRNSSFINRLVGWLSLFILFAVSVAAQSPSQEDGQTEDGNGLWFPIFLIVFAGIGGAFYFWRKSKKGGDQSQYNYNSRYTSYYNHDKYGMSAVNTEAPPVETRTTKKYTPRSAQSDSLSKNSYLPTEKVPVSDSRDVTDLNFDTKAFQERMRKLQYSRLPINSFSELSPAKLYEPLPLSDDPSVLNAIEQAYEEFEEDESVRELAVRILTAFRTRNSVEALTQIALYDLSSNLRSKAVSTLTDFDHESVFEAILLACADPTREVRAAAARGLFRLNFDRVDAWKRIIETNDEFRMSHAARAAIESGIVVKSFDRLVHEDLKVAYEAFTLISLIVKSGETDGIFHAIRTHKDERVRFALLHLLKVHKDERTLTGLHKLQREGTFTEDVAKRLSDVVVSFEQVMA